MGLKINGSVGKGRAQNIPVDVQAVQAALIATCDGNPNISGASPTGFTCDPETIAAIIAYQKHVLKLPFPDGVVAPGGATHNMLHLGKRWPGAANRIGTPMPPPFGVPPAPGSADPVVEGAKAEAGTSAPADFEAWEKWYRDGNWEKILKGIPGFFSRLEDGRRLFKLWKALRAAGLALDHIGPVLQQLGRLTAAQADLLATALTGAGTFTKFLSRAASRAEFIGLFTLAVDIFLHGGRGNWGAALGEVYKTVMNKAIPWAGMIEGLQSLVDAIPGQTMEGARKRYFFKVLRFCDPVGLGAMAPDAIFSLAKFLMAKTPEEGDAIINDVVKRLEAGPGGLLKPAGDFLGDVVYQIVNGNTLANLGEQMDRSRGPKW